MRIVAQSNMNTRREEARLSFRDARQAYVMQDAIGNHVGNPGTGVFFKMQVERAIGNPKHLPVEVSIPLENADSVLGAVAIDLAEVDSVTLQNYSDVEMGTIAEQELFERKRDHRYLQAGYNRLFEFIFPDLAP